MRPHPFLFKSGEWLGEGRICFNQELEKLRFTMKWTIQVDNDLAPINCLQEIHIEGMSEVMKNAFSIKRDGAKGIEVALENETIGAFSGEGFLDEDKIAWEFCRLDRGLTGFELYERHMDKYGLHGEYAFSDLRIGIEGEIWEKGGAA